MRGLPLVAAALLCTTVSAQQVIEMWPGATNFTSRGNLGTNGGELYQGFRESTTGSGGWRGIGDTGTSCDLRGMFVLTQDQNRATQENFAWCVRSGTNAGGPTVGSAGVVAKLGPFSTPSSTGTGAIAWGLTSVFSTAVSLPDCTSAFFAGICVNPAPGWTADGQSVHMSRGDGTFGASVQGASALSQTNANYDAWQIIDPGTVIGPRPSLFRTWRFGLDTSGGTLQFGQSATKTGSGGLWPADSQAYVGRIRAPVAYSGGQALGFISFTPLFGGFPLFPGTARLYLTSAPFAPLTGTLTTTAGVGQVVITIAPNVPASVGNVQASCQVAVTQTSMPVILTNAASAVFQ